MKERIEEMLMKIKGKEVSIAPITKNASNVQYAIFA